MTAADRAPEFTAPNPNSSLVVRYAIAHLATPHEPEAMLEGHRRAGRAS